MPRRSVTPSPRAAPSQATRARFRYDAADPASAELLVVHQSFGSCLADRAWHNVYLAPIKRAAIDAEGTMRLSWWAGTLIESRLEMRLEMR